MRLRSCRPGGGSPAGPDGWLPAVTTPLNRSLWCSEARGRSCGRFLESRFGLPWAGLALFLAVLTSAKALDSADLEAWQRMLGTAKIVEVPALVAQIVGAAPEQDRPQVASAVVVTALKEYPAAAGPCLLAAVRSAPEAVDLVVTAALEAAPESALAVVSAAAECEGDPGDRIIAVATRKLPASVVRFEREVALVRARRMTDSPQLLAKVPAPPAKPAKSNKAPTIPATTNAPTGVSDSRP